MFLIGVASDLPAIVVKAVANPEVDVAGLGEDIAIAEAGVNSIKNEHRVLSSRERARRRFFCAVNGYVPGLPQPAKSCLYCCHTIDTISSDGHFRGKLLSQGRNQSDAFAANFAANNRDSFTYLDATLPAFLQQCCIEFVTPHHGV